ncbi:MAG: hypothetical protein ACI976_000364 [Aureispira sp.]|jgi:hypothetical protein
MKTSGKDFVNPLSGWIDRVQPLPKRFYSTKQNDIVDKNWSLFISMEEMNLLHNVNAMEFQSFNGARKETHDYLDKASDIINGLEGAWLDNEEKHMILEKLGHPPIPCLPLYLISIDDKKKERLIYVGITKTKIRFIGGHAAALKLLNPIYDGQVKRIYRCNIWFLIEDEYTALEWIKPEKLGLELLDNIESKLIHHFKPELNTDKKKKNLSKWDFTMH